MEEVMDNFANKRNERYEIEETIKANFMAEKAESEALKKQLEENEAVLQSVRNLYLKQEENSELFHALVQKIETWQSQDGTDAELLKEIKNYMSKSEEFTHKECVKVYRNVQAVIQEQNERILERMEGTNEQIIELAGHIERMRTPDFSQEFEETKQCIERISSGVRSNKVWLIFSLLFSIANMAFILLIHFGLL